MNSLNVLWTFVALGTVWTVVWAVVLVRSRPGPDFETIEPAENRLRLRLLVIFSIILAVAVVGFLHAYPYAGFRARALGAPADTVQVMAMQWGWTVTPNAAPHGVPIEFVVRSKDVNHDFAVYDAGGRLVAQVQAMPGYANRLIYRFDTSGTYTVRCLEYCGIFHHIMLTTFTVR